MSKTAAEERHMERVASVGCVICRRLYGHYIPCELHHVAEGSGLRSNYAVAGLRGDDYEDHHDGRDTGGAGFHLLGTKRFCSLYHVPGDSEYGLLVMVNEDLAKFSRETRMNNRAPAALPWSIPTAHPSDATVWGPTN